MNLENAESKKQQREELKKASDEYVDHLWSDCEDCVGDTLCSVGLELKKKVYGEG